MYFVKFSQGTALRNNLDKAITEKLKPLERMRFEDGQLKAFEAEVQRIVDGCNAKHPRCKKVEINRWSTSFHGSDMYLGFGGPIMQINIHHSDKTFQAI